MTDVRAGRAAGRPGRPGTAGASPVVDAAPPRTIRSGLRCQVLTDLAQAEALRPTWDSLVQRTGGDIYFTLDWCRAWWRYYAGGRRLHVLLFWSGQDLVSLLPMVVDRLWVGPVPVRLAKLLGSDFTPAVLNPPVAAEHAEPVYAAALRRLLREEGCDAAWFGPLAGHRPHRRDLRRACQGCEPSLRLVHDRDMGVHTIFHLPATFDQYLASLDKSQRGNYRRDRRNLDDFHLALEPIEDAGRVEGEFDRFLAMHQAQWTAQRMLGHFGDWPDATAFHRDLLRRMGPQGRVRLERLRAGEQAIAYDFSLRLGEWLYWRLPARKTGPPWERLGLGRVSLVARIEAAIQASIRHIEAGSGHYDYKTRLGGTEYPLGSVLIAAPGVAAGAKMSLLRRWSDLLHLLYYRIWFSRIAPRCPLPRRPLRSMWIRSRL